MKLFYLFTVIVFSFFSNKVDAQEIIYKGPNIPNIKNGIISESPLASNNNYEGSPYINREFEPAKISVLEDIVCYVRYNAVNEEIEVQGTNEKAYALNKYRKDIKVEFISPKKIYQNFIYLNENGEKSFAYFVHISNSNSNIKLLKKENIKFFKERVAITTYDTPKPAKFERLEDKYFIKINDQNVILLPKNKKKLAELFPDHEKEVLSFIKKERLKLNKEEDLTKLFNFLNQLG